MITDRWFDIPPHVQNHSVQKRLLKDLNGRSYNNYVIVAGRRSFKTERFLKRFFVQYILSNPKVVALLGAPTQAQARNIFWRDIKALIPPELILGKPSEVRLEIELINGSILSVIGLQEFKRVQGTRAHLVGITEYQDCDPQVYNESFEPMLNDTGGIWIEEGRPFGKNHFYSDYLKGLQRIDGWSSYSWKASEVLTDEQILRAKANLTLSDYEREYNANFDVNASVVYSGYSEKNLELPRILIDKPIDSTLPIIIACDFNATEKPMSWVIGQQRYLEDLNKYVTYWHETLSFQYTNTYTMCDILHDKLVKEYHLNISTAKLEFYGDFAGTQIKSNSTMSDWEIIGSRFRNAGSFDLFIQPCKSIRNSVQATNLQLSNALGVIGTYLNKKMNRALIDDFVFCEWKMNSREIDESNPLRGHASRAIDYYNDYRHPIGGNGEAFIESRY